MVKKIVACLLCLCIAPAWAVDDGIYAGGSIGQSQFETASSIATGAAIDDEDTSFRFFIGWRTMDWFAVELGYVDFGGADTSLNLAPFPGFPASPTRLDIEVSGFAAQAIGLLKFEQIDLYGKAGLILWDIDTRLRSGGPLIFDQTVTDDGTDLTFGVGVKYGFMERWAARLEYERFMIDGLDEDLGMISAGITWTWF